MTREERACVAVRAHPQDQQVKHGDSVSLEGLKGKMVVCAGLRGHTEGSWSQVSMSGFLSKSITFSTE